MKCWAAFTAIYSSGSWTAWLRQFLPHFISLYRTFLYKRFLKEPSPQSTLLLHTVLLIRHRNFLYRDKKCGRNCLSHAAQLPVLNGRKHSPTLHVSSSILLKISWKFQLIPFSRLEGVVVTRLIKYWILRCTFPTSLTSSTPIGAFHNFIWQIWILHLESCTFCGNLYNMLR